MNATYEKYLLAVATRIDATGIPNFNGFTQTIKFGLKHKLPASKTARVIEHYPSPQGSYAFITENYRALMEKKTWKELFV